MKALQTNKVALERKLHKLHDENRIAETRLQEEKHGLAQLMDEGKAMRAEIRSIAAAIGQKEDKE